jgi:hypothetical protein|tara:strand:+ start:137 stop:493 length:357 start_codon:yes stop_codon:yes gene_type:complete
MAFKMKGPSLLKMVENERKNSPLNKNGDEPKLTMSDLGNLATKGAKKIREGIKSFSDSELMNIIKRNVGAFQRGKLKPGQEYRDLSNMPMYMEDIATRSDSTRAAINELMYRKDIKNK